MLIIALVLVAMLAVAALCALRLTKSAPSPAPVAEVSPMRATLERRIRDGADFRI